MEKPTPPDSTDPFVLEHQQRIARYEVEGDLTSLNFGLANAPTGEIMHFYSEAIGRVIEAGRACLKSKYFFGGDNSNDIPVMCFF